MTHSRPHIPSMAVGFKVNSQFGRGSMRMGEQTGLGSNPGLTTSWLCDLGKLLSPAETQLLQLPHESDNFLIELRIK